MCFTRTETLRDRDDDGYSFVCIYNLMRNSPQLKEEGKKTTHSDGGFAYKGAPVESLCSDDDFRWIHPLFSVHPPPTDPLFSSPCNRTMALIHELALS